MRTFFTTIINIVLDTALRSFFEGTEYPHLDNINDHATIDSIRAMLS